MFNDHALALALAPQGGRRSFQDQQYVINRNPGATNAGPGEGNHNYGQAVDLGYKYLRWLHADGSVGTEPSFYLAG